MRNSDSLRAGRSGVQIQVGVRFSAPVQTGPSTLLYNGYRVIPGGTAAKACRYPITPSRAEVEELKNIAILLLLCAVMARYMVNLPYLTLREEYNYRVGDENRVSAIKWGSNNEVQPADEKLGTYKSNWLQHVTRKNNDRMPKIMLNYMPYGGRRFGRPLK